MRWMLVGLIALLIGTDFTGINPGLGPGLSVKNAMLYLAVMVLAFRMALTGGFRLRMPGMHLAWVAWVGYALLTWLAVSLVLKYHTYEPLASAMALKSELIDCALYCFVAFYIVQTEDDFRFVLHALVGVVGISSVLTLTDLVGITGLGMKVGESGAEADRVFGAFGHANETGSFLACVLPPLIATTISSRGALWRLFWVGCTAATAAVFVLTVSRGAYVGALLGYPIAAYMLRSIIPPGRIMTWTLGIIGVAIVGGVIAAIFNPASVTAIADRFLGIGTTLGTQGLSEASSGRSDIWGLALREMMNSPLSLLTGFGWNAWSTMPTIYALHNQYLDQWFNLGLVGLVSYIALEYLTIVNAKRAAMLSSGAIQRDMIACVFGVMALSIAIIFENMFTPRPYMWMYTGLILRGVVLLTDKAAAAAAPVRPVPAVALGTAWRRA
jgi:O-antigen ligase